MELKGSDLSLQPIPPTEPQVQADVQHPDFEGTRRLDILAAEAQLIISAAMTDPVVVDIRTLVEAEEGGGLQVQEHRIYMSKTAWNKLGERAPMDTIMNEAKVVVETAPKPIVDAAPKIDYSTPENAGKPHRGKPTEAEAEYVRAHLDDINARLLLAGQRTIDPTDPGMAKRYGFGQETLAEVIEAAEDQKLTLVPDNEA